MIFQKATFCNISKVKKKEEFMSFKNQGCGTGKFEDGCGSDILSDYGSGSSPGSGSIHIHIRMCARIRKRIHMHILKHILIQYGSYT